MENTKQGVHTEIGAKKCEKSDGSLVTPTTGKGRGRRPSTSPINPVADPQVGDIVWAKVKRSRWWPATLVKRDDCGKLVTLMGGKVTEFYVYWYGDGRVSSIARSNIVSFTEGYQRFISPPGSRSFRSGVYRAITEYRKLQTQELEDWDMSKAFEWARSGFPVPADILKTPGFISQHVQEKLQTLRVKYEACDDSVNVSDSSSPVHYSGQELELVHSVRDGKVSIEEICLACVTKAVKLQEHPLFEGSICELCLQKLLEFSFSIGLDSVAFHCCICLKLGDLIVCSQPLCYRAYCCKCIGLKATLGVIENIRESDPWNCFLCESYTPEMHGLLKPRSLQWKTNMWNLFHSDLPTLDQLKEIPLRIMCCDGSVNTTFAVLTLLNSMHIKVESLLLCNYNKEELSKLKPFLPEHFTLLKSMREYQDFEALSQFVPVHIVISSSEERDQELFGHTFFLFHSILSMLKILNFSHMQLKIPMMWVFEALAPSLHAYNILITRYLQFDPAEWSPRTQTVAERTLVWSNVTALWPFLRGEGIHQPLTTRKKREGANDETPRKAKNKKANSCIRITKRRKLISLWPQSSRITRSMGEGRSS